MVVKGVENIEIKSKPIAGKTYYVCQGYRVFNLHSVKCRACASFDKCQELDYEVYAS